MDGLPTKDHISVTTGPGSAAPTFTQYDSERFGGGLHTVTDADTTSVVSEHPFASAAEVLTVHGQHLPSLRMQ